MVTDSPFARALALVAMVIALTAGSDPGRSEAGSLARAYEERVPADLRDLVTRADFVVTATALQQVAAADRLALSEDMVLGIAASPCSGSLSYLILEYATNPAVPPALDAVAAGQQPLPEGYPSGNPWAAAADGAQLLDLMVRRFLDWCVFLPQINGSNDNGLAFIQEFAWFYFRNPAGQDFVQGRNPLAPDERLATGLVFTQSFSDERGQFMDSPASRTFIAEWIADPRIEIGDYQKQSPEDYDSWNAFFARQITIDTKTQTIPSRPATMPLSEFPKRDYIVVAPTDCIMNPLVQMIDRDGTVERRFIENPLQNDTVLDVKGIPISVGELLSGAEETYREKFVGGTGLSCVLMPNTYHHFHAPVNGTIVHAEVVPDGTYGYLDWPNWVPLDGNVGRPGTDFSQFQVFQRGVIIIEVKYADLDGSELTGYVASIPVGLDTIGSVVLDDDIVPGTVVKRGYTRLGNFFYGGSLNILLFSQGLASGVIQTRLGNQITLFNVGRAPTAD